MSKRRASDHGHDTRPTKNAKTDCISKMAEVFPTERQVSFAEVPDILRATSAKDTDKFISGIVIMKWVPGPTRSYRFLMQEVQEDGSTPAQCEVVLAGEQFRQLELEHQYTVKIGLKGATFTRNSPPKPMRLVYENQVIFCWIDKQSEVVFVDGFEEQAKKDQDWFLTPAIAEPPLGRPAEANHHSTISNALPRTTDDLVHPEPEREPQQLQNGRRKPEQGRDSTDTPNQDPSQLKTLQPRGDGSMANLTNAVPNGQASSDQKNEKHGKSRQRLKKKPKQPSGLAEVAPTESKVSDNAATGSARSSGVLEAPQKRNEANKSQQKMDPSRAQHSPAQVSRSSQAPNDSPQLAKTPVKKHAKKKEREQAAKKRAYEFIPGFECPANGKYLTLNELKPGKKASFVGIVVEQSTKSKTSSGDTKITISLVDPTLISENRVLKVNCFGKKGREGVLPDVKAFQPLLLRSIHIKEYRGSINGVGYSGETPWVAFDPNTGQATHNNVKTTVRSDQGLFVKPTAAELEYFVKINEWYRSCGARQMEDASKAVDTEVDDFAGVPQTTIDMSEYVPAGVVVEPRTSTQQTTSKTSKKGYNKRGKVLLESVKSNEFIDCDVEVLEFFHPRFDSSPSEMYVTDYTKNPDFPSHRVGPIGRTMRIRIWDTQKEASRYLKPGHYQLKNVFVKVDGFGCLEGNLRGDHKDAFERLAMINDAAQRIIARKELLERGEDSTNDDAAQLTEVDEPILPNEAIDQIEEPNTPQEQIVDKTEEAVSTLVENRHSNEQCNTLSEVLNADNIPFKCRVLARVIDYQPKEFSEWIFARCTLCSEPYQKGMQACSECGDMSGSATFSYRFALKIRDGEGTEVVLLVSGQEAVTFLSNIAPAFLNNHEALGKFEKYVRPMLGDDTTPGPLLDLCIAGSSSPRGTKYTLFGCQLVM
ncbi:hypothetical protein FRC03_009746 [Tulasnella sp. 419]|nr:hypothetical protein FRC03_009746 [Tulasnella sp. 419]